MKRNYDKSTLWTFIKEPKKLRFKLLLWWIFLNPLEHMSNTHAKCQLNRLLVLEVQWSDQWVRMVFGFHIYMYYYQWFLGQKWSNFVKISTFNWLVRMYIIKSFMYTGIKKICGLKYVSVPFLYELHICLQSFGMRYICLQFWY